MPKCKYKSNGNKITKGKAEKNKNQKKKRKLTFLGNFPFRPFLFRRFRFRCEPHLSASLLLPARGPSGQLLGRSPDFLSPLFFSLRLTSGTRATATGRSSSSFPLCRGLSLSPEDDLSRESCFWKPFRSRLQLGLDCPWPPLPIYIRKTPPPRFFHPKRRARRCAIGDHHATIEPRHVYPTRCT